MLPPDVIIGFNGLNSEIPDGWVRDDDFNAMFLRGTVSNLRLIGGADNHSHTATHAHTINPHTHSITTGERIDGNTHSMGESGSQVVRTHSHSGSTGSSGSQASNATIASFNSESNLPPFYELIFIRSTKWSKIPALGVVFRVDERGQLFALSSAESRFIRGAGENQNAGDTGGNSSHSHSQSHTHTVTAHSHANSSINHSGITAGEDGVSSPALTRTNSSHSISVQSRAQNMNSNSTSSNLANVIPEYTSIGIYVTDADILAQPGDIVITTESINPVGFINCDGANGTPNLNNNRLLRQGVVGDIGGANTHSHEWTHNHTGNGSHTHTPNNPTGASGTAGGRHGSGRNGVTAHRHNITNVGNTTANYSSITMNTTTAENIPPNISVKFIQLQKSVSGGGAAILGEL